MFCAIATLVWNIHVFMRMPMRAILGIRAKWRFYAAVAALLIVTGAAWADPTEVSSLDPTGEWLVGQRCRGSRAEARDDNGLLSGSSESDMQRYGGTGTDPASLAGKVFLCLRTGLNRSDRDLESKRLSGK